MKKQKYGHWEIITALHLSASSVSEGVGHSETFWSSSHLAEVHLTKFQNIKKAKSLIGRDKKSTNEMSKK